MQRKFFTSRRLFIVTAIVALVAGAVFFTFYRSNVQAENTKNVQQIVTSESLILQQQQLLNKVSKSALNLKIPDSKTVHLFHPTVTSQGLSPNKSQAPPSTETLDITKSEWPIAEMATEKNINDLSLFKPLLDSVSHIDFFKIKIKKGHFEQTPAEGTKAFITDLIIDGAGYSKLNRSKQAYSGHAIAHWTQAEDETWKLSRWELRDFSVQENPSSAMFVKANSSVIPSDKERRQAERCIQEELIISLMKTGNCTPPGPRSEFTFAFDTSPDHPGLSVVDINNDGWDDFYLMSRWGKNQLFVNQQDGTLSEQAAKYGLDILNHCTSAVFADFDNDGDPDLMLGRSQERSLYLQNQNGFFKDVSNTMVSTELPPIVTSVSAADYNSDGLLDVFFSTYGNAEIARKYLSPAEQRELASKFDKGIDHPFLNGTGIANVLLVNQGDGKFALAKESEQLAFWQTTLQSTWADFDRDGDPDVYICNDFGPDRLMRNDYPNGFTEVTQSTGHQTMAGFGMGATWGDYDLDGKLDLYVSNMYSKAGIRITDQISNIDNRFKEFVNGNRLYRQGDQSFEYTSGLKPPKMLVAKVGWSWGGQFADFDNDGYLDLYVPSGHFTAPDEVATADDL